MDAAAAKSLHSCPTLCDPIDGSPPGSPVPGILQARTLEWVAISFSNAWKWKVKSESEVTQSFPTLSDPIDCSLPGSSVHGIFQARVLEWDAIAFSSPSQLARWIWNKSRTPIFWVSASLMNKSFSALNSNVCLFDVTTTPLPSGHVALLFYQKATWGRGCQEFIPPLDV